MGADLPYIRDISRKRSTCPVEVKGGLELRRVVGGTGETRGSILILVKIRQKVTSPKVNNRPIRYRGIFSETNKVRDRRSRLLRIARLKKYGIDAIVY